jgi:hypothetical protein
MATAGEPGPVLDFEPPSLIGRRAVDQLALRIRQRLAKTPIVRNRLHHVVAIAYIICKQNDVLFKRNRAPKIPPKETG